MAIPKNYIKHPNLFIIGCPRCGTTSLARWLAEHPDVFFFVGRDKYTKIEPHYWCSDLNTQGRMNKKTYFRIFKNKDTFKHAGEASTWYLYSQEAIKNIERAIYSPKYILLIRNPIELVYSLWNFRFSSGREEANFLKAFHNPKYTSKLYDYKSIGKISYKLERLYNLVPQNRILVLILDDIKKNPTKQWKKVTQFLDIKNFKVNLVAYNANRIPRNRLTGVLYRTFVSFAQKTARFRIRSGLYNLGIQGKIKNILLNNNPIEVKKMPYHIREILLNEFLSEIERLEKLLNRKFDSWKIR